MDWTSLVNQKFVIARFTMYIYKGVFKKLQNATNKTYCQC